MTWRKRLGTVGVWRAVGDLDPALARTVENLGFGTVWQGASPASDLRAAEEILGATRSLQLATGIVNIWTSDPAELAGSYHRIQARHPGRLLLGIGSGHREATTERARPLEAMARYLDVLDAHDVPQQARVLSALGPRMLGLAAARSAGTHPYLTVPSQSAEARQALGPGALVAPEQTVVFDTDPESARRTARTFLGRSLALANYRTTMLRGGFSEADIAGDGSDNLVDRLVPHGDATVLAAAVRAHLEAGADHVCIQVQPAESDITPALRAVAGVLGLAAAS
jgi:probable F420-dependent oxidoreductase